MFFFLNFHAIYKPTLSIFAFVLIHERILSNSLNLQFNETVGHENYDTRAIHGVTRLHNFGR